MFEYSSWELTLFLAFLLFTFFDVLINLFESLSLSVSHILYVMTALNKKTSITQDMTLITHDMLCNLHVS